MRDARDEELIRLLEDTLPRAPRVPRERMWEIVRQHVEGSQAPTRGASPVKGGPVSSGGGRIRARGLLVAGIVLLTLGIGIGRWTAAAPAQRVGQGATAATLAAMRDPGQAMASTLAHLSEVDVLLELFQESGREEWARHTAVHWAEALLQETRVLIDLHRRADPGLALLLQDLELVLIQVARLEVATRDGAQWEGEEIRLISEALLEGSLRPRIRGFIPMEANSQ